MGTCRECGKEASSEAKACPHCGATKPVVAKKSVGLGGWILAVVVGVVAFQSCTSSQRRDEARSASPAARYAMSESEALTRCQEMIRRQARDPETANVPFVRNMGKGTEAYFAWGAQTKMARMRNGLGLEVAVSASCIVDLSTGTLRSLTVDGKALM